MKRLGEEEKEDSEAKKRIKIEAIEPEQSIHADGGGWRRGKYLGSGAHGTVYLAHFPNPALSKRFEGFPSEVAVKSAYTLSESKALEAEKEIYKSLPASPFVLRFLGDDATVDEDGERSLDVFLEYASGGSLNRFIHKSGKSGLRESQARAFTRTILLGLSHIHESDIVHRDLKPNNVLLVEDGDGDGDGFVAKMGDFGLARSATSLGGTEMLLAQKKASDIRALGCVVYAMLTGKRKRQGQLKFFGKPIFTKKLHKISAEAKNFLRKCFTKSHTDRPNAATLLNHPFVTGS